MCFVVELSLTLWLAVLQDMVLLYPPNEREILIRRATSELATALGAVICHDKNMTYTMAEHCGVPYPASMLYHDEVGLSLPPTDGLFVCLLVLDLAVCRLSVRRIGVCLSASICAQTQALCSETNRPGTRRWRQH